jgi:Ca-activated chloride channel family protein
MRKSAVFLLLSLFIALSATAHAQTRPRRVEDSNDSRAGSSTPTPPTRPPVLSGVNTSPQSSQPAPQSTPAQNEQEEVGEGDVVRVSTTLVTVPVSVMDRNGRYIPNLRQGDFHIYEDGVEQQVAYFASVEKPFTVVLMIDTSGSTQFKIEEIQDAAIAFVDQLRPDDRVMVVSFNDDIRVLIEPTNDRYALRSAIRRARTGDGTKLYDAVDFVINRCLNRIDGRKAIVLFTDGVDTTSRRASFQTNVRDAEELDALIYPVQYDTFTDVNAGGGGGGSWPGSSRTPTTIGGILGQILGGMSRGGGMGGGRNAGTSREDYERADRYLNELAEKTGARLQRADDVRNISQAFAVIAEELRRQYSLGYYPKSQAQAGQRRQIRVRVNQPNLVVRARDSYIYNNNAPGSPSQQDNTRKLTR